MQLATKISTPIGILLIVTGLFVSSFTFIEILVTVPLDQMQQDKPVFLDQLIVGALLFKIGLVVLGILTITLVRLPIWKSEIQSKQAHSDKYRRFAIVTLSAILFTSLVLRIYGLNRGLWLDEIFTYIDYASLSFGEIISIFDSENNHVLYSLFAHSSFLIFGESVWSLRLPAVLFGVGSIWAIYLLGRQLGTVREGLLSAALVAFSYQHIWFSQNARGYTGLLFWTIITSWLFLRGLNEKRAYLWLLYAVTVALGFYTHIAMLFMVIGHFTIYLLTLIAQRRDLWPKRWIGIFFSFCLAGFCTLQLYAFTLPQIYDVLIYDPVEFLLGEKIIGEKIIDKDSIFIQYHGLAVWKTPLWAFKELVHGLKMSFTGSIGVIAALILFGAGLLNFKRKNPIIIQLLIIPVIVILFFVVVKGYPFFPRYFFFTVGFGAIIIVRGTMELGKMITRLIKTDSTKSILVGTVLCSVLIIYSAISIPFVYAPKQDYQGALTYVEENSEPGDAIVTIGPTTIPYKRFYGLDWNDVETLRDFNDIRSQAKRVWFLYTLPLHVESKYPEIMKSIKHDFKVVKQFHGTLKGGTIYICLSISQPKNRASL